MTLFKLLFSNLNKKRPSCNVGRRLFSRTKRKALLFEKEIFVHDIKHFRVSIEGSPIKNAVILSESALQNDHYKGFDDKINIKTLL